jgi:hypothetical protein
MRVFILRAKYHRFLNCLKKIIFIQLIYKNYYQRKIKAVILIQKNFRNYFENKIAKIHNNYNHRNGYKNKYNNSKHSKNSYNKKNKISIYNKKINRSNNKESSNKKINKSKNNKEKKYDITKELLEETNTHKIINTLLYNKDFMIDADKKFNTDYYRTIYKVKFVYPYLHTTKNNEPKLEDRLIQYGEDKKLKHLLNNFKYYEGENNKCSFKPKINDIYEFEDSFYQRNLKFMKAKKIKLEYNKLKEDEIFKNECTFKPKINENKIKRTLDDLFKWKEKINKEKEEIKQLYEEFTEKQIQNMRNFKPKNNYYSNMKYLERMADKMEESKDNNINTNKEIDSKSSYLSTKGFIDFGKPYDVWPLHLKKDFP